jgi:hypothetical protein
VATRRRGRRVGLYWSAFTADERAALEGAGLRPEPTGRDRLVARSLEDVAIVLQVLIRRLLGSPDEQADVGGVDVPPAVDGAAVAQLVSPLVRVLQSLDKAAGPSDDQIVAMLEKASTVLGEQRELAAKEEGR